MVQQGGVLVAARLRGIECNAPPRLAEAFFVRKILA
jgi:hypothetical protein